MSTQPSATDIAAPPAPAQLAKAALRRLAMERQEPTPENFRAAYAAESAALGWPVADTTPADTTAAATTTDTPSPTMPVALDSEDGPAWSELIGRIARGLERSNKQWTAARRKDSLQRVLAGSKQSSTRLLQRLQQLALAWDSDRPEDADGAVAAQEASLLEAPTTPPATAPVAAPGAAAHANGNGNNNGIDVEATRPVADQSWVGTQLADTLYTALPSADTQAVDARLALEQAMARALTQATEVAETNAPQALQGELRDACDQARRVIEHRHHLMDQLVELCRSLTDSLVDLAEDDSWARGQSDAMRAELDEGLTSRGARRIQQLLEDARQRQRLLKQERETARQALKQLIHQMLSEIGELGQATGRFQDNLSRYADTIGQADTLESLTGVVREMVTESRTVHGAISQTQERLHSEHVRATELTLRVRDLEDEIRKLSDEVSTDPLTQIANRRGLMRIFDNERSRVERQGQLLAIGLLDVDNFKKLNDTLGHHTGDEALKFLTRRVSESLRPSDALARYGGEEFVVMMPNTEVEEGQQVLTRLQRQLSAEFFTQDTTKVFITFSAGVTQYREDEPIEQALDRADVALYEAKRTGKNRTCIG